MNKTIGKIVVVCGDCFFDIKGYYKQSREGHEYFIKSPYGNNILAQYTGYYVIESFDGSKIKFSTKNEPSSSTLNRLKQELEGFEIIVNNYI